jgi:hypothetical protein
MMDSKTSAGSLMSCCFIFLDHFLMFLGFLITSNLPDLISLYSFCLFLILRSSFISRLFSIFFSFITRISFFSDFISSLFFFFSSQLSLLPRLPKFLVGILFTPVFQGRPLLLAPMMWAWSLDLIYYGCGNP